MKQKKYYSHEELHNKWMENPEFRREYEKLAPEFQIANQMIAARLKQKMSQEELALKADTAQEVISRLENMNARPSISLLVRIAHALNTKLRITID